MPGTAKGLTFGKAARLHALAEFAVATRRAIGFAAAAVVAGLLPRPARLGCGRAAGQQTKRHPGNRDRQHIIRNTQHRCRPRICFAGASWHSFLTGKRKKGPLAVRKRPKSREETPKKGNGNFRYRIATIYFAPHKNQD
jgi:hypothetical protein